jgi:hypothetical protein
MVGRAECHAEALEQGLGVSHIGIVSKHLTGSLLPSPLLPSPDASSHPIRFSSA